ncbi:hypothetical protein B0G62_112122 [Paraburkholderia eburnea]|uniref:MFS transporter n=1 Tax=Paraburkholderia eburnea TaxID=1189126 RepID=A0A2S4M3D1_9BURK|nr:hypothetical protein [Paraburkholderia eburnea]POR49137.1 hypothetical protein B0G62_112122 [Paraburkholderia eburnea]PRZ19514.1 hypothetical protein BX588_115122 [Paraburkholderia eburnea]
MGRATAFWCAVTGGAAALAAGIMLGAMQAGASASAFAANALALLAMALLPPMFARRFGSRATLPCAAALVLTMGAMSFAAAQARAGVTQGALPLALAGFAMLMAVRRFNSDALSELVPPKLRIRFARPDNGALIGAALLAGISSGVLARFQLFALCGAGPFSLAPLLLSLGAAIGFGAGLQHIGRHHALLLLFSLRGALLAALTLDATSPWSLYAAPTFALLDALTLPTLLRNDHANHATQGACPGIAHHVGMLAGAAFATTSWGFGQGFYALFSGAAALNFVCASTQMARRNAHSNTHAVPSLRTTASSGIDFH